MNLGFDILNWTDFDFYKEQEMEEVETMKKLKLIIIGNMLKKVILKYYEKYFYTMYHYNSFQIDFG